MLTPQDGRLRAELYGDLAVLGGFAQAEPRKSKSPGSQGKPGLLSMVAGTRSHLYRTRLLALSKSLKMMRASRHFWGVSLHT